MSVARVALLATGGLLLLVACGGGGEEELEPTPTSEPQATVAATPTPTPTPPAEETVIYIVESGDTGLAIALRFDITLGELADANGMTEEALDHLQIGQELRIPR